MKAKNLGPGKHFDGQGLMLVKQRKDVGKWILRLVVDGKRREKGLGRWPDVSIEEARDLAFDARRQVRDGHDQVPARQGSGKEVTLRAKRDVEKWLRPGLVEVKEAYTGRDA